MRSKGTALTPLSPDAPGLREVRDALRGVAGDGPTAAAAPLPDQLARFCAEHVAWLTERLGWGDPVQVTVAAAALSYGPRGAALDVTTLDELLAVYGTTEAACERGIERLLVHGVLLPPAGANPWRQRWQHGYDVLLALVEQQITDALAWIGKRVLGHRGEDLYNHVAQERRRCGVLIRAALTQDSTEFVRWHELSIASRAACLGRLDAQQRLWKWDRQTPLSRFLWIAANHARLHLAKSSEDAARPAPGADCVETNGFRKGLLAMFAAECDLRAGQVLRCTGSPPGPLEVGTAAPCGAEVGLDDRCVDPAHHWGKPREGSWWLWVGDDFVLHPARRCQRQGGCAGTGHSCLFFGGGGDCPCPDCLGYPQGQPQWSQRITHVWVRTILLRDASPARRDATTALRKTITQVIAAWPDGPQKTLAFLMVRDRLPLGLAAERMCLDHRQPAFAALCQDTLSRIEQDMGACGGAE